MQMTCSHPPDVISCSDCGRDEQSERVNFNGGK